MEEAFEIAYDDETKQWIKRPCTRAREEAPEPSRSSCIAVAVFTIQAVVGLWILWQLRN